MTFVGHFGDLLTVVTLCVHLTRDLLVIAKFFVLLAAVDCGLPPILLDSIPMMSASQRTTYGGQAAYRCVDGRWFGRDRHTEVATCTADGLWEVDGETQPNRLPACIRKYDIAIIANNDADK